MRVYLGFDETDAPGESLSGNYDRFYHENDFDNRENGDIAVFVLVILALLIAVCLYFTL